jgi:hypothetical protein
MVNKNNSSNSHDNKREEEKKKTISEKENLTIKEFVDYVIRQNPLVYKRLAEI